MSATPLESSPIPVQTFFNMRLRWSHTIPPPHEPKIFWILMSNIWCLKISTPYLPSYLRATLPESKLLFLIAFLKISLIRNFKLKINCNGHRSNRPQRGHTFKNNCVESIPTPEGSHNSITRNNSILTSDARPDEPFKEELVFTLSVRTGLKSDV